MKKKKKKKKMKKEVWRSANEGRYLEEGLRSSNENNKRVNTEKEIERISYLNRMRKSPKINIKDFEELQEGLPSEDEDLSALRNSKELPFAKKDCESNTIKEKKKKGQNGKLRESDQSTIFTKSHQIEPTSELLLSAIDDPIIKKEEIKIPSIDSNSLQKLTLPNSEPKSITHIDTIKFDFKRMPDNSESCFFCKKLIPKAEISKHLVQERKKSRSNKEIILPIFTFKVKSGESKLAFIQDLFKHQIEDNHYEWLKNQLKTNLQQKLAEISNAKCALFKMLPLSFKNQKSYRFNIYEFDRIAKNRIEKIIKKDHEKKKQDYKILYYQISNVILEEK